MSKRTLAASWLALAAGLVAAPRAGAQAVIPAGGPAYEALYANYPYMPSGPGGYGSYFGSYAYGADGFGGGYGVPVVGAPSPAPGVEAVSYAPAPPDYRPPYSYPAAYPYPARSYVPYGPADDFVFYGRPYGHPYDKWTWSYISNWPSTAPKLYFYQILR